MFTRCKISSQIFLGMQLLAQQCTKKLYLPQNDEFHGMTKYFNIDKCTLNIEICVKIETAIQSLQ